ncbi:hypothetical protein RvY_01281 [Ramazzottius varieornatus]|uniref:Uncharacterized protein n=1 Tax=Ramazzottius varieornatus TaxID=947166 RepID=A0A1D1ULU4_RAMVA|nr:hypothetical protein RvY_01281 [Ramazzottius varieornatus]
MPSGNVTRIRAKALPERILAQRWYFLLILSVRGPAPHFRTAQDPPGSRHASSLIFHHTISRPLTPTRNRRNIQHSIWIYRTAVRLRSSQTGKSSVALDRQSKSLVYWYSLSLIFIVFFVLSQVALSFCFHFRLIVEGYSHKPLCLQQWILLCKWVTIWP